MKIRIALWIIAIGLVTSAAGIAKAQDSTTTQQTTTTTTTTQQPDAAPDQDNPARDRDDMAKQDSHSNVRTLTGCLQRGEGGDEYMLMGQDGSTWEMRSDAVDLASHVGQSVTITGAVPHPDMHGMKEDTRKEAQEHGMAKGSTEHGHLTVTNLSVVASRCSR
jgi:hypothetical protein